MVMKLPELSLNALPQGVKGAELAAFVDKCKLLTSSELADAMKVSSQEVFELIAPNVPCVGCRRRFVTNMLIFFSSLYNTIFFL